MDKIILSYHYSPGFYGEFILKDLEILDSFDYSIKYFWYFDSKHFPDNEFERRQQRRFTKIKDSLPKELEEKLQKILASKFEIIKPEVIKSDKIEYATSAHPKSEYYKINIQNVDEIVHIPYDISQILIGDGKQFFLDFHTELQSWLEKEFEIASEGKAYRFNKK
ncbi:hypothetical protein LNP04_11235 [Chryseobacterium sp. C-71]|uniref:hypothetical protein n=1 Tax=Chryseobacterium sp. C-71 TaxID=2893882 RepID=UPI001E2BEC33|nr:hypothetical protein [Chryseobacterium sp. C-71]UFH30550.1 hypothetical protein LNP04_11235 [Chryseobacterium sp. C-71]